MRISLRGFGPVCQHCIRLIATWPWSCWPDDRVVSNWNWRDKLLVLGVFLTLLAGCGPAATPSSTAVAPTALPPLPTPADARFGAAFLSTRLNITDLPCADLQEMGIRSTFFGAWWGEIEPQPDQYDWSLVDGPVDAALACGVEPVLKVSTGAGPGHDGMYPEDLDAYSQFVSDLARHLKGRVRVYAIENEVGNPRMEWWTPETYGPLRAAAYEAIKQVNPDAQVLDGLMTLGTGIFARANELLQAGQPEEALAMLDRFYLGMRRKCPRPRYPTTEQELIEWLSEPYRQRDVALVEELFEHPETYDTIQIHYLQDAWELIPEYVAWIRDWLAKAGTPDKPFEFWEIGFGWDGECEGEPFTEESHAQGVVKTLVVALGEGASRVIYEPYWEEAQVKEDLPRAERKFGRGLVTPDGPRLAATAYQTMASQLSGYQSAERLDPSGLSLGAGVWAYRFATPRGDVYVVWAEENTTVHLPLAVPQVPVTDITGGTTMADPAVVPVGASPIFINIPLAPENQHAQFGVQTTIPRFGINYVYHQLNQYTKQTGGTPEEYISQQHDKLCDLGVGWIRSAGRGDPTSLNWGNLEPEEGVFDFALHDMRVKDAQARDLFMLENVDFSNVPGYAQVEGKYFDDDKYLEYLNSIVERYDGDGIDDMPGLENPVRYWEIGNEVIVKRKFRGTAQDYAHVLKISYEHIKASCPDCYVVIGGWIIGKGGEDQWQRSIDYFDQVLSAGGGDYFDIMNYHEYSDDYGSLTYYHVNGFRDILAKYGFDKPIWITEANTILEKGDHARTLEQQAQDIVKRIVVAFDAGVDVFMWHGLDDVEGGPGAGLFDEHGAPKPNYYNLELLIAEVRDFDSVERIDLGNDDIYFYKFYVNGDFVSVLWAESEDTTLDLSNYFDQSDLELIRSITEYGESHHNVTVVDKSNVPAMNTPVFIRDQSGG